MTSQQLQCSYNDYGLDCKEPALDGQDRCLFHAPVEAKDGTQFYAAIQAAKLRRGDYHFQGYVFPGDANFRHTQFGGHASFSGARFGGHASFSGARFGGTAYFFEAQFSGDADFGGAQFSGDASFSEAQFSGDASFLGAQFSGAAHFGGAKFSGDAGFSEAKFSGDAGFTVARFSGEAYFRKTKFPKGVSFRGAEWEQWTIFESAEFDNVTWNKLGSREGVTADELAARKSGDPGDFKAAERVYLHLRRSYQTRLDYPRAREFYYGEMEMRRLAMRSRLRRWFSLTHLYYLVSGYGQDWVRAAGWLIGITLAFAFAYALSGLIATQDGTLLQIVPGWNGWSGLWDAAKIWGESLLYSINAAVLRPGDFARPLSGWGRTFQAFELVLGPAFITILVLAIREQFRR